MVEKVFASGYLSIKVHTDSSIALSATQVTKNSPPQAGKRLGLLPRLWFNFFILQKIEGDYDDQRIRDR